MTQHNTQYIIEWNKEGIVRWMHEHDVYGQKTPSEQQIFENTFVDEAIKHQVTAMDRKLYRKGLKVVKGGRNTEHNMKTFMEL